MAQQTKLLNSAVSIVVNIFPPQLHLSLQELQEEERSAHQGTTRVKLKKKLLKAAVVFPA